MAKRKSKVGFLGLANKTWIWIGVGVVGYYLLKPKNTTSGTSAPTTSPTRNGGGFVSTQNTGSSISGYNYKKVKYIDNWSYKRNKSGYYEIYDPKNRLVEIVDTEREAKISIEDFASGEQMSVGYISGTEKVDKGYVDEVINYTWNERYLVDILENVYVPVIQKKIDNGTFDYKKGVKLMENYFTKYVKPYFQNSIEHDWIIKLNPKERYYFGVSFLEFILSDFTTGSSDY